VPEEEGERNGVRRWGKIIGYVAGRGEFENVGLEPLGSRERAEKKFEKINF